MTTHHNSGPRTALVQLVSEETMQALLPILAFQPARVVHFATPLTRKRSMAIAEGARQGHWRGEMDAEPKMLSAMPDIGETCAAVTETLDSLHAEGFQTVVNFTGGTKLMSIGAYQAAKALEAASLYLDTGRSMFIDGMTGASLSEWLGSDLHFGRFLRQLSVNAIAVANGQARVTGGRQVSTYLPLARSIFQNDRDCRSTWEAFFGAHGLLPKGEPRRAVEWLPLFDRPLCLPPDVAAEGVRAGLLDRRGDQVFLRGEWRTHLDPKTTRQNYFEAVRPVQFAVAFFTGGWWEVIVADAAEQSKKLRDVRWSVNVGATGGLDREEDVVGVHGASIAYISCKLGFGRSRLLGELDALDNRARSIGGKFSVRFLALYCPPTGRVLSNLSQRARELNRIRIITPSDLNDPAKAFA